MDNLKIKTKQIRKSIIAMLAKAGSGHPGGSLGMVEIFTALYYKIMKNDPKKSKLPSRDYLFLSNGHICPVLYATLAEKGYFPKKELLKLRKINSRVQGHPHYGSLPGIESSSGPLGQGLSVAVGAALALKADNKKNNIFAICGDGELNEGMIWEALMITNKYVLDNLTIIVDRNNIQLDGATKDIMDLGDIKEKFVAFGFHVFECDGNDMEDVLVTLRMAVKYKGAAKVVIAHTTPGKGVSFMENDYHWHGKAPSLKEAKIALEELE